MCDLCFMYQILDVLCMTLLGVCVLTVRAMTRISSGPTLPDLSSLTHSHLFTPLCTTKLSIHLSLHCTVFLLQHKRFYLPTCTIIGITGNGVTSRAQEVTLGPLSTLLSSPRRHYSSCDRPSTTYTPPPHSFTDPLSHIPNP